MECGLSLRPFEAGDQEQARWLILNGLGEHFGYIDETRNPDLDDIQQHYIVPGHVFVVACMGRELVGTGALVLHGEGISQLVRISTRKDCRRRGIGLAISTYLVNIARQRGGRRILVETNASWQAAIDLYKRLGFVEYERTATTVGLDLFLSAP
jgi:ribosomal protein S18 acetylase RimI-like enzyme